MYINQEGTFCIHLSPVTLLSVSSANSVNVLMQCLINPACSGIYSAFYCTYHYTFDEIFLDKRIQHQHWQRSHDNQTVFHYLRYMRTYYCRFKICRIV